MPNVRVLPEHVGGPPLLIGNPEFEQEEDPSSRSFFSEIISSISDVRFSNDGRYILSRDYLTVKIWDVNMERQPVKTIPIHEHLRPRLCDTYENDSIFDKFEVVFSGDGGNVMTGSYNNNFMIYPTDPEKETEVVLQADKSAFKAKKVGVPTPINSTSPTSTGNKKSGSRAGSPAAGAAGQGGRMRKETDADAIDFNKKILHMSWHPFEDSIAIAATNNVSAFTSPAFHVLTDVMIAFCLFCVVIGQRQSIFSGKPLPPPARPHFHHSAGHRHLAYTTSHMDRFQIHPYRSPANSHSVELPMAAMTGRNLMIRYQRCIGTGDLGKV